MSHIINYKSDFDLLLNLKDGQGNDIGIPDYDWTASFRTSSHARTYTASRINGVYTNCFEDHGRLHIVFDGHRLPPGTLHCDFKAYLPNDTYPDGSRTLALPVSWDIELVTHAAPCPETLEVELLMPYIKGDKGDPFVYEDFTPEQLADLRRPAEDAAKRADASAAKANEATRYANTAADAAMGAAGKARIAAEEASSAAGEVLKTNEAITDAEQIRKEAEKTRVSNEQARGEAESLRKQTENDRRTAETERAKSETERGTAEQTRVDSESLRVKAESERKSSEESRAATENTRVEAENLRIAKEQARQDAESARAKEFDRIKQEAETATSGANSAAEAANKAASNANGVADGLQSAINSKQDRLADSEDITVSEDNRLLVTDSAKRQLFIDQWNEAAGKYGRYNEQTGFFELNGLVDITYEEALTIHKDSGNCILRDYGFMYSKARTFYLLNSASGSFNLPTNRCFNNCSNLEVLRTAWYAPCGDGMFNGCSKLRRVYGGITNVSNKFLKCPLLEYAEIVLVTNIDLSANPLLDIATFNYIIAQARNTATATITVHPDVYAKLTGDTTNDAYNDLTDEEKEQWTALVPLALSKNIAFATV